MILETLEDDDDDEDEEFFFLFFWEINIFPGEIGTEVEVLREIFFVGPIKCTIFI